MFKRTLVTLALTGCVPASAFAYNTGSSWPEGKAQFVASDSTWSDILKSFSLLWAESIFNQSPAKVDVSIGVDTNTTYGTNNLQNEIVWTSDIVAFCGSSMAACAVWDSAAGSMTETDVFIDSTVRLEYYTDRSDTYGYGGAYRPMVPLLLHEMGHAMGLGHENRYYNVMGLEYTFLLPDGENYEAYLGADATSGLRYLYGTDSTTRQDLTVTHWRYDSVAETYSRHRRTGLKTSAGVVPSSSTVDGETAYIVKAGTPLKVEATYENAGTASQTATVKYYLSSDRNITTADTYVTSASLSFNAFTPNTVWTNLTLPSTLSAGSTWFIGAIADPSSVVSEYNEDNNSAYLAQVTIQSTTSSTTSY